MTTLTQNIFINCSVDVTFDYCTNDEFFDRWMPNVLTSQRASDKPLTKGSTFTQEINFDKKIHTVSVQVVLFEPKVKWSCVLRGPDFSIRRTWILEKLTKGTKVYYNEEITRHNTSVFGKLFSKTAEIDALSGLKRDLESKGYYLPNIS